jgi:hypothetical protein
MLLADGVTRPHPIGVNNQPSPPSAGKWVLSFLLCITASNWATSCAVAGRSCRRGTSGCRPVAHSMSGVVAAAAAELAPELFAHLVYVTAFAPVVGMPAR